MPIEIQEEAEGTEERTYEVLEEGPTYSIIKYEGELNPKYIVKEAELSSEEEEIVRTIQEFAYKESMKTLYESSELISKKEAASSIMDLLTRHLPHLTEEQKELYTKIVLRNMFGYGRVQVLVEDDNLEEIMVNGINLPIIVAHGIFGMCETNIAFDNDQELKNLVDRIARITKRKIDLMSPLLDARLSDGSRVNSTIPPISLDGATLTIRKFREEPLTMVDLIKYKTIDAKAAAFLWTCVEGLGSRPLNMLVVGGTGSGKTTTLNCLADFVPINARVITIEDTAELNFKPFKNLVRLETRRPNIEGKGEVSMDTLLINTLRMRPDRIIVGEIRGSEAETLFTAMNTGHEGCMGTLHANSAGEVVSRLTTAPMNVPLAMLAALKVVVVQRRLMYKGENVRKITEISELRPIRKGSELEVNAHNIFEWDPKIDGMSEIKSTRILEPISDFTGFSLEQIINEIDMRETMLNWMVSKGITGRKELRALAQRYYADKESVIDMMVGA